TPWLRKLAEQKDAAAQAELAMSAPEQLKKMAKPLMFNVRAGEVDESLVNCVVVAEGRVIVPVGATSRPNAGETVTTPARRPAPRVVTQPPGRTIGKTQASDVAKAQATPGAKTQAYTIVVTSKGSEYKVSLDTSQIANFKATPDMHVRVYGTLLADKTIKGLLAD